MKRICVTALVTASAALVGVQGQGGLGQMVEWPYVGADQSHTKFSPAAQITPANVDQLKIVWE